MIDVEERARRAGAAARTEAHARAPRLAPPEPRPVRAPRPVLVAAGLGLVALLVAIAVLAGADPRTLEIDPLVPDPSEEGGALPVPDVGDVLAVQLADGTPVFVTQPEPGEVLVLDAVDPHLPAGQQKLLVFCRPSAVFEDPRHGSRFDQWGNWLGGPAPTGLALYPSEATADGGTIRVVGSSGAAPARDAPRGEPGTPQAENCQFDEASSGLSDAVMHRRPADVPALDGARIPGDRWVWATLVLGGTSQRPVACAADGTCRSDAPELTFGTLLPPGTALEPTTAVVLARTTTDGRIDVLHPTDSTDPNDQYLLGIFDPREQPALVVPVAGEASAAWLVDGTPVFVTHPSEGEVHVLAAGIGAHLVGWCADDQRFHAPDAVFAADGSLLEGSGTGLDRLPSELATSGGTRVVRLLDGQPQAAPRGGSAGGALGTCARPLVHRPEDFAPREVVQGPGPGLESERWQWVRMPVAEVEGELRLCYRVGPPNCGLDTELRVEPESCVILDEEPWDLCWPGSDPRIATPGITASRSPILLLIRPDADGRQVQVRQPAPSVTP
jgi:hypothetical protein